MTPTAARPLVVFADDWGRHPSSCQHLIGKLIGHREILWVNTIGTRPPRLDYSTLKRVAGKLKSWTKASGGRKPTDSASIEQPSPRILSPKMWPSFHSRMARSLNRKLLLRALRPAFESLSQTPNVITTLPLVADLVGELPANRWTYYCVDDFSVWPGYDGETMAKMERDLLPKMDEVVAVSDTLVSHISTFGKTAKLLTHGVDLEHWRHCPQIELPEFAGLVSPLIVFWGVIDRRLDLSFVKHLASNLTTGTMLFIGPQEDPDQELFALPRVKILPAMPFAKLPAVAAAASVLVMPYADLPVTRAMQPLKLKEYLATGKPVVVRDLPATRSWAESCDVCPTKESFTATVLERLASGVPVKQQADRSRLDSEGWLEKAKQFENWVDGEVE